MIDLEAYEADRERAERAGFCDIVMSCERFGALLTELRRLREERDGWQRLATNLSEAVCRAGDWADGTRVGDALEAIERALPTPGAGR